MRLTLPVEEAKRIEFLTKHYYDLFAYHAAQRLTTFNFFIVSLSFTSTAYATLVTRDGPTSHFQLMAGVLAFTSCLFCVAFGRLDSRNEQIIRINEVPLELIQASIQAQLDGDGWETLALCTTLAGNWRTYGSLIPTIYAAACVLTALGGSAAFTMAHAITIKVSAIIAVAAIAVGLPLIFIRGKVPPPWRGGV